MESTALRLSTLALIGLMAAAAAAGPLNPPESPASTPGPEPRVAISEENTPGDADSSFRIDQPGSYHLTGNVTGESGRAGIEIAASGVTIDLSGFALIGVPGSLQGIREDGAFTGVTIRNGTVREWADSGLFLPSVSGVRLEGVTSARNAFQGGQIGPNSIITSCVFASNESNGLFTQAGCAISDCTAFSNGSTGLFGGAGSVMSRCTARENEGDGLGVNPSSSIISCVANLNGGVGIRTYTDTIVRDSVANFNDQDGIVGVEHVILVENSSHNNGLAGIHVTGAGNRIEDNTVTDNATGIDVDVGENVIVRNTIRDNPNAIEAGNVTGPLVTSGADPDFTHPWANFSF